MRIEKIEHGFRATVPCKLNLRFEVLGKRSDGYHDVDTIMQAISLCDELEMSPRTDAQLRFRAELPIDSDEYLVPEDPAWSVPQDRSNLVVQALERLREAAGDPSLGADILLRKRIPAQAGLGGGSADAAAALVLGSLLWQEEVSLGFLAPIASKLGSDINFFLESHRGTSWVARCKGRGERVEAIRCDSPLHFVVLHPPEGCNTSDIFSKHRAITENHRGDDVRHMEAVRPRDADMDALIDAITLGNELEVGRSLYNGLESAAATTSEWIARSARCFDRYDPLGQSMTGSGSARFCLCRNESEAEKIHAGLRQIGEYRVYRARSWQTESIEKQIQGVRNNA